MPCICPTVFCQSEDAGETPGELTERDEERQENAETIAATERKEVEGGDELGSTDTEPTDYQPQ